MLRLSFPEDRGMPFAATDLDSGNHLNKPLSNDGCRPTVGLRASPFNGSVADHIKLHTASVMAAALRQASWMYEYDPDVVNLSQEVKRSQRKVCRKRCKRSIMAKCLEFLHHQYQSAERCCRSDSHCNPSGLSTPSQFSFGEGSLCVIGPQRKAQVIQ